MTTQQQSSKTITLSYGLLAFLLLVALLIGGLSGGILGSLATVLIADRAVAPSSAARAWVGVTYVPVTPPVAQNYNLPVNSGALILSVTPNSPAAKSGLRERDIITAVDQRPIDESTSLMDLIIAHKPGDHVQITMQRGGQEMGADVVLGELPGSRPPAGVLDRLRRLFERWRQR
jgi:S1-C subfamily serine protease